LRPDKPLQSWNFCFGDIRDVLFEAKRIHRVLTELLDDVFYLVRDENLCAQESWAQDVKYLISWNFIQRIFKDFKGPFTGNLACISRIDFLGPDQSPTPSQLTTSMQKKCQCKL
jgi:hypothetical protein